jgi:hypothetical protein
LTIGDWFIGEWGLGIGDWEVILGGNQMAKYMLLLHDNPAAFADVSPEQMQQVIEKYIAWGNRLREAE